MQTYRLWLLIIVLAALAAAPVAGSDKSVRHSGSALAIGLPLTALTASLSEERGWQGTGQILAGLASAALATEGLKRTVDKQRPDGDCCDSFPSGHTAAAFVGAAFLHERYGRAWGMPALLAATYVGWSRIRTDQHDAWDVAAGAAIGAGAAYLFATPYRRTLTVIPQLDGEQAGLVVRGRF